MVVKTNKGNIINGGLLVHKGPFLKLQNDAFVIFTLYAAFVERFFKNKSREKCQNINRFFVSEQSIV